MKTIAALLTLLLTVSTSAVGQTFKGKLGPGAIGKVYKIPLKKGRIYNISMTGSDGLDTLLRVQDMANKKVAENDDIGLGNLNSRLIFSPGRSGTYQVVATSYMGDGVGSYTLRIESFIKAGKPTAKKGRIDEKSPVFRAKIRYQRFRVQMQAGAGYLIGADSKAFNAVLGVRRPGGKMIMFDDDGGEGTNARMIFTPKKTGQYEILVAPRSARGRGDFLLSYQTLRPAPEASEK